MKAHSPGARGNHTEQPSAVHERRNSAMLLAVIGVIAASALLWFGVLAPVHNDYRQHLAQSAGVSFSQAVAAAADRLEQQAQINAQAPSLLQALGARSPDALRAAQDSLPARDGLLSARLVPLGQPSQGEAPPPQVEDMIRRAERNVAPRPQIYQKGERWLLYSVIALRETVDAPVIGTLIQVFDAQPLTAHLASLPEEVGLLRLSQRVWNGPEQVIFTHGFSHSSQAYSFSAGDNHLTLSFSPGALYAFTYPTYRLALMALAALLALAGAMAGLYLCCGRPPQPLPRPGRNAP